jgi:hypothetical protein
MHSQIVTFLIYMQLADIYTPDNFWCVKVTQY